MKFVYYNNNPKHKKTDDCVIRAIALATDDDWYSVYEKLSKFAMHNALTMNDKRITKKYLKHIGYNILPMPRRDNTRYTVKEFADELAEDNVIYILQIAKHLTVVKNKALYDTWNCSYKSVGNYWRMN